MLWLLSTELLWVVPCLYKVHVSLFSFDNFVLRFQRIMCYAQHLTTEKSQMHAYLFS